MAREAGDIPAALMNAFSYDDRVLMERFVAGRELAVSVIGTAEPWALPVVEAIPRDREFYDFEARYTPGLTDFVAPARLPDAVAQEAARARARLLPGARLPGDEPGRHDPRRRRTGCGCSRSTPSRG